MQNRISWGGLLIGLVAGLGIGLVYTWLLNPVIEYNTAPWQLSEKARDDYLALVALAYQHDQNLARAEERLKPFNFTQPGVAVARRACEFFRRAQANELESTFALVELAHAFGEPTCADFAMGPTLAPTQTSLIVVPTTTATTTHTPTATHTPTVTPTFDPARLTPSPMPSPTPAGPFEITKITPFCNARFSGALEIYVREADGTGIPGVEVKATWGDNIDRFFTGLQPGEDPGFANFTMNAEINYQVELPGRSSTSEELAARPCVPPGGLADGEIILNGYVVTFTREED